MASTTYEALNRSDLVGYDKECIDLAMDAQELGWVGKMSSKGHLIMRAPDGETTMSITRNAKGRALWNQQANLDRWKRKVRNDAMYEAVAQGHEQFEKERFLGLLAEALDTRTGEFLEGDAAEVMRTVYSIVLDRDEIADFAFSLAKDNRISDFGWLSGHPDDTSELRAWNVNWAVFDRRDGRVIDVGGPRVAPTGETWDREFVEVKVAEQLAFERRRDRGELEQDEQAPAPHISEDGAMSDPLPYQCTLCDRAFKLPQGLGRHMSTIHKPVLEFVGEDPGLDDLMGDEDQTTPVTVQMDDRLTIVVDGSTPSGQSDGETAADVAAAMGMAVESLSLVARRMALLENERGEYQTRLAEIVREYEAKIAAITAERDNAQQSLNALKALVADL